MAFDRNSKADTLFLSDRTTSTLFDDQSQYHLGLVNNTTYLTSTSTRFAVRSPRGISVVANISSTQTGILLNQGPVSGATPTYRLSIAGGSISFIQGAATVAIVAAPNVTVTAAPYLIHWSTEDAGGGSYYSEVGVCRVATGVWTITRATHALAPAYVAGDQFNIGGYGAGVSIFTGGISNITKVRVGARFASTTEGQEDWVAQSSTPTITGRQPGVELAPHSTDYYSGDHATVVGNNLLDAESFAGPAEWLAVLHAGEARQRLYSPLVNLQVNATAPTLQDTYLPANWHSPEPLPSAYGYLYYSLGFLWARVLPSSVKGPLYGRVRVHVQTWLQAGSPGGTTPKLQLRMLSSGVLQTAPSVANSQETALGQCTTDHTSAGTGEWVDLGEVRLVALQGSLTYLLLGYGLGPPADTGRSFRRARIKAVELEIYTKD